MGGWNKVVKEMEGKDFVGQNGFSEMLQRKGNYKGRRVARNLCEQISTSALKQVLTVLLGIW